MRLSERLSINRQEARKPQKPGSQETSPFGKGGSRGIFQVDSLLNPPWPPFFKGGNPFVFSCD